MNKMYKSFTFFLIILIGCGNPFSKNEIFESIIKKTYDEHPNVKGIMLHVEAPKESISWSGAVGYSNWEETDTIEVDQPAIIASMTKTYVATAILRLVEQGELSLDQKINNALTAKTDSLMRVYGFKSSSISIAHLLSHKSGIPDHVGTELFNDRLINDPKYRWTRDEQIVLALKQGPLFPPETRFVYTDMNYLLLTEIIEKATRIPFNKAIAQLIGFEKLGLKETWFYTLDDYSKNTKPLIHQYVPDNNEHNYEIDNSFDLYGGGGLAATTKDASQFFFQLFNGGIFEKKETLDLLFTDIIAKEGDSFEDRIGDIPCEYFLGIQECGFDGLNSYWHSGYWGTIFRYFPELDAVIVLYVLNEAEFENIELDLMKKITHELK